MLIPRKFGILVLVCTLTALVFPGSCIVHPRRKPTYKPDFVFPSEPDYDSRRLPTWDLSIFDHSTGSSNQRSQWIKPQ